MVLALKLFFLAVRQCSKPIANRAKDAARRSDTLKEIFVGIGRGVNRLTTQVGRLSEGKSSLAYVTPLNEAAAIDKGADTLGEFVIYGFAVVTVAWEYNYQERKKQEKERKEQNAESARLEAAKREEERLHAEFMELRSRMLLMEQQLWALRKEQAAAHEQAKVAAGERRWFGFGTRA